jgi:hypothetical protein
MRFSNGGYVRGTSRSGCLLKKVPIASLTAWCQIRFRSSSIVYPPCNIARLNRASRETFHWALRTTIFTGTPFTVAVVETGHSITANAAGAVNSFSTTATVYSTFSNFACCLKRPRLSSLPQGSPLKKRKWGREIEGRMSVIPPKERPLGRQGVLARRQKPNTKT